MRDHLTFVGESGLGLKSPDVGHSFFHSTWQLPKPLSLPSSFFRQHLERVYLSPEVSVTNCHKLGSLQDIYSLMALEARSPRSRFLQGCAP